MKSKIIHILLLILLTTSLSGFAQKKNNSQLAFRYYKNREFDKAAVLYNELYQNTHSKTHLVYLIKCYNETKSYNTAEKLLKKEIRKNKRDNNLKVILGTVYRASGNNEKADKIYQKLIQKLDNKQSAVTSLANAFISNKEFKYAEQTYLKHQNKNQAKNNHTYELANVYYYWRKFDKMIDAYLDALISGNRYLKSIESRLQYTVYNQDDGSVNDQLKQKLISRIQKSSDNPNYYELLIWVYLQEKDFGKAFIQTKALDKRAKENGKRLIELGQVAAKNKDYDTAIRCFEYVKNLGNDRTYYFDAQIGYISTLQSKVLGKNRANKEQVQKLVNEYKIFLEQNSSDSETADIKTDYAHILCFYQHNISKSFEVLESVIYTPKLKNSSLSKAKIEYADQLLYNGQIWDATLFYSQVIQANPNNEIGNEAQLKKAKLAFYSGDFLWAKGQLDVLKASTSKLISNNAFYISSLISDNLEVDTLTEALKMYAAADLFVFRNLNDSAMTILEQLEKKYGNDPIADDVLFKKAKIVSETQLVDSAITLYQQFIDKYYYSILADKALMKLANLYWEKQQKEKATELYTQLLIDFPDSFLATEARQKIVQFRDS